MFLKVVRVKASDAEEDEVLSHMNHEPGSIKPMVELMTTYGVEAPDGTSLVVSVAEVEITPSGLAQMVVYLVDGDAGDEGEADAPA